MIEDIQKLIGEINRIKKLAEPTYSELGVYVTLTFGPSFVYERHNISRLHEKKIIEEIRKLCSGEPEIQWHDRYLYSIEMRV